MKALYSVMSLTFTSRTYLSYFPLRRYYLLFFYFE